MGRPLKFDLHVHTREGSSCALVPAVEVLQLAAAQGLDGVVFTDHHRVWDPKDLEAFRKKAQVELALFSGQEITFHGLDFLVLGWDGDLSGFKSKAHFVKSVRAGGGVVLVAHPFSALYYLDPTALAALDPDGVEVFNTLKGGPTPSERKELSELGLAESAGSDFHQPVIPGALGNCWTEVPGEVDSLAGLMEALRSRRTVAVRS